MMKTTIIALLCFIPSLAGGQEYHREIYKYVIAPCNVAMGHVPGRGTAKKRGHLAHLDAMLFIDISLEVEGKNPLARQAVYNRELSWCLLARERRKITYTHK